MCAARKRRVVVTGMGLVTPLGIGLEENWKALIEGRSGIDYITRFDTEKFAVKIAGEVKDFNPADFIPKKQLKNLDFFLQYALAAARMAADDASIEISDEESARVGVITGCGLGGLHTLENSHITLLQKGPRRISPFFIPMIIANMAPGLISIQHNAKGPNLSIQTACAAGNHAIGLAYHMIRDGIIDVAFTGGVESTITPMGVAGFTAMKALSTRNDEPAKASRPFDKDRDGFVLAEGAAILVLESEERALERGAKIYAEICGFGLTGDAYHMTAPAPNGEGAARCMQMALDDAGLKPEDIDYINAHGTSTDLNDKYETAAIKQVFGDHAYRLAVSSTKSMTGHLLGAAGGVEAAYTVLTVKNKIIPPTINYETPDPDCDLDYVPNKARRVDVKIAMSNSFGFGGTNAVVIMREWNEN
ncbi:MAG TPA: beta-ketoacyl-[acyl-carrier-protein] synthase II [Thermodesulforhabdus norvegica]|uniref:3-oxoacyl-[acyl-carrier-protein] synthase 2 n=1 Tax=Thermodesulforhabdus norvegica TaxID=39841 RepID=A0A7C1AUM6_9BACT|nr:beta-ketoacyl-ACP synthase II [Deltaproteobacteria bacterium]MBW2069501.1 beta-ketoacyl-ACP synthase II [Deltaproteobacteria bacterium]HDL90119.1 beta-ketoacyl-[acyl-carrier-protein] synthase II [Thermodesulforhabdus norvegica]